jgi:putative transposase
MTKAPLGGDCTGPNPTDRAKQGTKRSLLTDGHGLPLGLTVAGANCPDMKLAELTIVSLIVPRPRPTEDTPQHLCLDKGYDAAEVRQIMEDWGYTLHLRTRGEETTEKQTLPGYRARRWVVERSHSWMNRFRRLVIRWEKNVENDLAMLHFACAYICFKATGLFG